MGKSDCAGQGVWGEHDSGGCLVVVVAAGLVDSGSGDETRTLSANDSARALVDAVVVDCCGAGVVAGLGLANGFSPAVAGLEFDEKGFELADTALVSEVAPNRLAPRSCFGFCGALDSACSSGLVSSFDFCDALSRVTLRVAR